MDVHQRYAKLADFGMELLSKNSLEDGLPLISKYVKDVIGADRCSIFIYDREEEILWTTLADGINRLVIPSTKGIVGTTLKKREPILINDAYSDPQFLSDVDKDTGYVTHNVITAPIFDSSKNIMGILELLNKNGGFDEDDKKFMVFFAHYISGFIELVKSYTISK